MADSKLTQLTIDGGEVPHPPPRPRVACPECGKTVVLCQDGTRHDHTDGWGSRCPGARERPWR